MFCPLSSMNLVFYNKLPSLRHISYQDWLIAKETPVPSSGQAPVSPSLSAKRRGTRGAGSKARCWRSRGYRSSPLSSLSVLSISSKSMCVQMIKLAVLGLKGYEHPKPEYPSLHKSKENAKGNQHLPARSKCILSLASSESGDFTSKRNCYPEQNCPL